MHPGRLVLLLSSVVSTRVWFQPPELSWVCIPYVTLVTLHAELTKTCGVLHTAAQDQALSVRVAVLTTVANLTDTLKQQQAQLQTEMLLLLSQLATGTSYSINCSCHHRIAHACVLSEHECNGHEHHLYDVACAKLLSEQIWTMGGCDGWTNTISRKHFDRLNFD